MSIMSGTQRVKGRLIFQSKLIFESGLSKSQAGALKKIVPFFQNISASFQFYLMIPYQKGEAAFTYLY